VRAEGGYHTKHYLLSHKTLGAPRKEFVASERTARERKRGGREGLMAEVCVDP